MSQHNDRWCHWTENQRCCAFEYFFRILYYIYHISILYFWFLFFYCNLFFSTFPFCFWPEFYLASAIFYRLALRRRDIWWGAYIPYTEADPYHITDNAGWAFEGFSTWFLGFFFLAKFAESVQIELNREYVLQLCLYIHVINCTICSLNSIELEKISGKSVGKSRKCVCYG